MSAIVETQNGTILLGINERDILKSSLEGKIKPT